MATSVDQLQRIGGFRGGVTDRTQGEIKESNKRLSAIERKLGRRLDVRIVP